MEQDLQTATTTTSTTPPPPPSAVEVPVESEASGVSTPEPTSVENKEKNAGRSLAVKQQLSVAVLVGLIALAIIIVVIIRPTWEKITSVNQSITQAQEDLTGLKNKEQKIKQAQTAYQGIANDLPMIEEAVPTYSDVPRVMRILEKIASQLVEEGESVVLTRVSINAMPNDLAEAPGMAVTASAPMKQRTAVSLAVSLKGSYESIREYIIRLRGQRHNFSVERLMFFASNNQSQFLDTNVTLQYYYYE